MKVSCCSFNILAPMWGPEVDPSYQAYYFGMEALLPLEVRLPKVLARVRHYDLVCLQEVQECVLVRLRAELAPSHRVVFAPHAPRLWAPHDGSVHGNAVFVARSILSPESPVHGEAVQLSGDGNVAAVARLLWTSPSPARNMSST